MPDLFRWSPAKTAARGSHATGFYLASMFSASAGRNGYFMLCAWLLIEPFGSAGVAAFFLFVSLIEFITSAAAGVIADRWDRRQIAIASDLGRAGATIIVWFSADQGYFPYVICISGGLFSVCDRLFQTASLAMIPSLAAAGSVANLSPIVFLIMQLGNLAVALLVGILLDVSDIAAAFVVISGFFIASTLMLVRMGVRGRSNVLQSTLKHKRPARLEGGLISFSVIYAQLYGSAILISVAGSGYVLYELHGSVADFAYIEAAWSLGSILGAVLLMSPARPIGGGSLAIKALVATAVLLCLFKFTGLFLASISFLLMGTANTLGRISVEISLQTKLPDTVLGRAKGAMHTIGATLGLLVFGFATLWSDKLSASTLFATFGAAMIPGIIGVVCLRSYCTVENDTGPHR